MAKKSILYIITKSVWGGAAVYTHSLAKSMSGEFDVSIAAGGKGKFYERIKEESITYYNIVNFQRNVNIFKEFLAGFEILSLLFQVKPDIIHSNSSKAGGVVGVAGLIYKLLVGKKVKMIFTAHGWAVNEDRSKWQISLIKIFSKITSLFYDEIICVSVFDKKTALRYKLARKDKLTVIHNGIDIEKIKFLDKEEAQKKLLGHTSDLVVGTIAEWTKNKGISYLLKAVKKLDQKFEFILIGGGENPDKKEIYNYIKNNHPKNINLIEFIANAATYLKAFDVFVLPSVKEGLPYTIIEAMAAEVPVISTDVGGIPELINKETGFLIKPKKPDQIKEKIEYITKNKEKVEKITKRAREKIEKEFSIEQMIRKTKEVYN